MPNFTPGSRTRDYAEWFDDETQQWYATDDAQWTPIEGEFLPPSGGEVGSYDSPSWQDIGFTFTPDGYSAPSFQNINFQWLTAFTGVFNLGASLTGIDPKQGPVCSVKHTGTTALGYTGSSWQILKTKTVYECMFDLGGHIYGYRQYADLFAFLSAKSLYEIKDLSAFIGGVVEFDLAALVFGIPPRDLAAYLHAHQRDYVDLGGYIRAWHIKDLGGIIGSVHDYDLPAILNTIQPKDLPAFIKSYPQEDLPATIVGWAERNLGAFIKMDVRDYLDLGAEIGIYVPRDLKAFIKGWVYESPFDLGAYINPISIVDLPAEIFARPFGELLAIIYGIPPRDLPAFIHGWQEFDLPATINPFIDFRKDLQAIIDRIPPKELPAEIHGWQPFDLGAIISGYGALDLGAIINAIGWANLGAIINVTGDAVDLGARITPRLIKLAVLMPIHTMEYLDLGAVINLAPCYNLGIADLSAIMNILQKGDLGATIYGLGLFGANIRDLTATILVGDTRFDRDAADDLVISFSIPERTFAFDDLSIRWWEMVSPTDELDVSFMPGGGVGIQRNLIAAVIGHNPTFDLGAYINGVVQSPYVFGDPIFGAWEPDNLFTAPYIYQNRVLWERLVEITFLSQVYEYFYQSVTDSLWKDDNTEKWILNVASWLEEETYLQDKTSLREKILNDIEEFESVDEAVRYAIDWVISFPTKDLGARVEGTIPPYTDLLANITSLKTYTRTANLQANAVPFHPKDLSARMRIYDYYGDLGAYVKLVTSDNFNNLNASITGFDSLSIPIEFGAAYTPGSGGDIDLDFS